MGNFAGLGGVGIFAAGTRTTMNNRALFLQHVAQTSPAPMGLEITQAGGVYMYDPQGRQYIDLISGFSVMHLGHGVEQVQQAIKQQVDAYMHLMVYGEIVESPQVQYAHALTQSLPPQLDCVYFTNSGTEATEGAMKLAKRVTGKTKIIACNNAYHGSTQGALSIMGSEYWRNAYRPLLPGIIHADFNSEALLQAIDGDTACVVMEVVQAEAGVHAALHSWLQAVREKCTATGTLLVFDEIQTGFGRTGTLWAFEQYGIVPDILLLGKALGAGMPLGAFISSYQHMQQLTAQPVLGHISTFAGHPVCCAAGLAGFRLLQEQYFAARSPWPEAPNEVPEVYYQPDVLEREQLFRSLLKHPAIVAVRSRGLLMAVELPSAELCIEVCHLCMPKGVVTDWFLFAPHCLRIAPPYIISNEQIQHACTIILAAIEEVCTKHTHNEN